MKLIGKLIVFEGSDYSGKTTQAKLLTDWMDLQGIPFIQSVEPGGTVFGQWARSIIKGQDENISLVPKAELFLLFAQRAQHVSEVIKPALQAGKCVVLDRFFASTFAYQMFGRGLCPAQIDDRTFHIMSDLAADALKPDMIFWFDMPVEESFKRKQNRPAFKDTFDQQDMLFHKKVRQGFKYFFQTYKHPYVKINATGPIEKIQSDVVANVKALLEIE